MTSLGLLNAKKDTKVEVSAKTKEYEATDETKDKAEKASDNIKKHEELIPGFQ